MTELINRLVALPGNVIYLLVAVLVAVEDTLLIGFVVPGETAAILGGVAAGLNRVSLTVMIIVVTAAAIIGDSLGYEIGRRFGIRVLEIRPLRRRKHSVDRARELMTRRGGQAILLGRFIAYLRTIVPALAGISKMPYQRFLLYNAIGGVLWSVGSVLAGYLAGSSYQTLEKFVGRGGAIAIAILLVSGLIFWRVRTHRRNHRPGSADRGDKQPPDRGDDSPSSG